MLSPRALSRVPRVFGSMGVIGVMGVMALLPACAVADTGIDDGTSVPGDGATRDAHGDASATGDTKSSDDDTGSSSKDTGTGTSDTGRSDTGSSGETGADTGGGKVDAGPTCVAVDITTCGAATPMGKVAGDTGSGTVTATGSNGQWLQVIVSEDDSSILSSKDLKAKITLDSPSGENFDLYVYVGADGGAVECSAVSQSSTLTSGSDSVDVTWNDKHPIGGHDDTRVVSIEVRPAGEPCDASATWTVTVEGNK